MMKNLIKIFKLSVALNGANKAIWRKKMYKNRWKNFFSVLIFIGVAIGFVFLGFWQKQMFFTIIHWYLYMIISFILLGVGVITWFSYLWIIIKGE